MSMTLANSKRYVAQAIGGQQDSATLSMAADALQRTYEEWESAADWNFLLRDTAGFSVAGTTITNGSATVNAPSAGAFDGVVVGQSIGDGGTKIPSNTTVIAVTVGTDGTVTSLTMSANGQGGGGTVTAAFGGDIALTTAVQEYNLPTDFRIPYHARLVTNKTPLDYIQYRYWDRRVKDHTATGTPAAYTVYNPISAASLNHGNYKLRLFPTPSFPTTTFPVTTESITLQYYRRFNRSADPIDIPDQFLYKFLDYARYVLLRAKNATDERLPIAKDDAETGLKSAIAKDQELMQEDEGLSLYSQLENANSITRTAAKMFVARAAGSPNDPNMIAMADEAIRRAHDDWESRKDWNFLLKEASGFRVTGCTLTNGSAVIPAPTTGAFDGVNIGVAISGTHVAGNTTILSFTRNTDGTVATITMSHNATGTTSAAAGDTMIFGADIPVIASTQEYNLPPDFRTVYHARLLTAVAPLDFIQYRNWNRRVTDHTATGTPVAYTVYNPQSAGTQAGNYRMRLFRIPTADDTLRFQYYRRFIREGDPLDIPAQFLNSFLDYAQWMLLLKRIPFDERLAQSYGGQNAVKAATENAEAILMAAMQRDDTLYAEDEGLSLTSNMEDSRTVTRTAAKLYIARSVGAPTDPDVMALTDEALHRTYEEWEAKKDWNFLLRDTQPAFLIPLCPVDGLTAVIPVPISGAFDGINIGVSVIGTGIAANSTVASYTRNADGTIASITLNNNTTIPGTPTLTFSGDIPLVASTQEYNLPVDYRSPYFARLLSNKTPLDYIQYSYWNRRVTDQTATGVPVAYTMYNPLSADSQTSGNYRLRLFKIPAASDTLTMQYYRRFNRSADPIDIPQQFLYQFLDHAAYFLLMKRNPSDPRLQGMQTAVQAALEAAATKDGVVSQEDSGLSLVTQLEDSDYVTRTSAKFYIARQLGMADEKNILALSEEALRRTYEDWEAAKNWMFLLRDMTGGYTVAGVSLSGSSTQVNAPSVGVFDFINLNQGVSGTGIAPGTVVSTIHRATDNTIDYITLSIQPSVETGITLTFAGNIPLMCNVGEYNLPLDFHAPYHGRLVNKRLPMEYTQYRYWNRKIFDHTITGLPETYTVYNPQSSGSQNYGTYRMDVFRIPNGTTGTQYDTMYLQYYRKFNKDADPLDVPSQYLYKFLDYAKWVLLASRAPGDPRLATLEPAAKAALQSAMVRDEELAEEEEDKRMVSSMEASLNPRPLWNNGQFTQFFGEY